MGVQPKPTYLRLLEGNRGKRPLNKDEPKPTLATAIPTPPDNLGEAGRKEWNRLAADLIEKGALTQWDLAAFEGYCFAYERFQHAQAMLKQHGDLITTPNGMLQSSPYVSQANKAMETMHKFALQFGLTPASRTRITVQKPASNGSVEERLFGNRG